MRAKLIHFFTTYWLGQGIVILAECLLVTVPLLVAVAYMTYVDRKVWASIQLRRGPNVVGPFGLLQPFADGLKLVLKETIVPSSANGVLFIIAPMITFTTALIAWAVVPFNNGWVIADINVGILYLFAISSLGVYANMILLSAMAAVLFLGGWLSPIPYAPFTYVPGIIWFCLKIAFLLFVFSWTKGTLPRYRYDQLMRLGWKVFLPVSLGWVVI